MTSIAWNPYLEHFRAVEGDKGRWSDTGLFQDNRSQAVGRYAWAVPNQEAIQAIAQHGPIVEIGAGSGYWACLLSKAGVDVVAYDLHPPSTGENHYDHKTEWFPVQEGGPEVAARYSDRSLLLCWPPYKSPMSYDCLKNYLGRTVIYIGETPGGCTGSQEFHDLLAEEFEEVREVRLPCWNGIHDSLTIHKRKS